MTIRVRESSQVRLEIDRIIRCFGLFEVGFILCFWRAFCAFSGRKRELLAVFDVS